MKAFLKFLLVLLTILVAAVLALHLFLNPNDYKDQISAWVEEHAGRRLTLEGELRLSFFPWVGLEIHQARLAQPAGFGEQPFLRVQKAQARLDLQALLRGRLELGTLLGTGWSLHLIRAPDGRTNWEEWRGPVMERPLAVQPLPGSLRAAWENEDAEASPLPEATGDDLVLTGVRILWDDQENGNQLILDDLGVRIPQLDPDGPLDLNLTGQIAELGRGRPARLTLEARTRLPAADQHLVLNPFVLRLDELALGERYQAQAELRGSLTDDLPAAAYRVSGLDLTMEASGGTPSGKPLRLTGQGELDYDARARTLAVRDLVLESGTLRARGLVTASGLDEQPDWRGHLSLEPVDARAWVRELGLSLPSMADPAALSRLTLASDWRWSEGRLDLNGLDLGLDQTRVTGSWSWVPGEPDRHTFDLKADQLVLDNYLPPATVASLGPGLEPGLAPGLDPESKPGIARESAKAPEMPFLVRLLIAESVAQTSTTPPPPVKEPRARAWDAVALDGQVRVGLLTWRGLKFGEFDGHLSGQDGQFQLRERVARFYAGSLSGQVDLDARQAVPAYTLQQRAQGVSVADLLGDLLRREPRLSGRADLEVDLEAQGLARPELVASLSGRAALRMPEGELQGFDLEGLVQTVEAQLRGQAKPAKPTGSGRTRFTQLQATAHIERGILETKDLRVATGHFQAIGTGQINLPREELDLTLVARVDQAPAGSTLEQIKGIAIPVRILGSFQFPEYRLDPGPVIEELARRRLQRELGGSEGNALQQLEQRTGIRGLEQGLKSLLGR